MREGERYTELLEWIEDAKKKVEDLTKRFEDVIKRDKDVIKRSEDISKRVEDVKKQIEDVKKQIEDLIKLAQNKTQHEGLLVQKIQAESNKNKMKKTSKIRTKGVLQTARICCKAIFHKIYVHLKPQK